MTRPSALLLVLLAAACGPSGPEQPRLTRVEDLALPSAPGSLAPFLHVGPEGILRASWLDPLGTGGHALRVASHDGESWSEPATVASGEQLLANWADTPTLRDLGGDELAITWPVKRPAGGHAYDLALAFSEDGGRTWSDPITPHDDDTDTEHGFPTLGPGDGRSVLLAWLDGRDYAGDDESAHSMSLRVAHVTKDGTVEGERVIDDRVCDCCPTDSARVGDGWALVYRDRSDGGELRDVSLLRWTPSGWSDPVTVHEDGWEIAGCPVNGPAIDSAGALTAVAWFTAAGGEPAVWAAFLGDARTQAAPPLRVDEGSPTGRVSLVVDEATLLVSWIEDDRLLLRRLTSLARTPAYELAALPAGRSSGMPRLVAWGQQLAAAWTGPGEPGRVRVARVESPPVR